MEYHLTTSILTGGLGLNSWASSMNWNYRHTFRWSNSAIFSFAFFFPKGSAPFCSAFFFLKGSAPFCFASFFLKGSAPFFLPHFSLKGQLLKGINLLLWKTWLYSHFINYLKNHFFSMPYGKVDVAILSLNFLCTGDANSWICKQCRSWLGGSWWATSGRSTLFAI